MSQLAIQIAENLARIHKRMAEAALASGRPPEAVALVAVTKYVGLDETRALVAAGCHRLAESRPQQLWQRSLELEDLPIQWHLIGHLQRNKVTRTLPLVEMIQSIDSSRLIAAVEESAALVARKIPVLLEVNASGEGTKQGFEPDQMESVLAQFAGLQWVEIRGLMCMASLEGGSETARRDFARLRELRDQLRCNCPPNMSLDELSMGMSGDYEVAIQEGATMVRVGSALFEGIQP